MAYYFLLKNTILHPTRTKDLLKCGNFIKFGLTSPQVHFTQKSFAYLPSQRTFSKQFFRHYIKLNMFIPSEAYTIHGSYSQFYLLNSGKNLSFLNIKGFFRVWSLFIAFLENLFYYNISVISFSSPYLKEESLSLN